MQTNLLEGSTTVGERLDAPPNQERAKMVDTEAAKFRLKMLNSPGVTSRSGIPSSRNLARKFRSPRLVNKSDGSTSIHPLDRMHGVTGYRLTKHKGEDRLIVHSLEERYRDTTGSFGDVSTFQGVRVDKSKKSDIPLNANMDRASRIVVTAGAPGKSASRIIQKRSSVSNGIRKNLATPDKVHLDYNSKLKSQLLEVRANMMTLDFLGQRMVRDFLGPTARECLNKINGYLVKICSKDFLERLNFNDRNREKSLAGMLKAGHVEGVDRIRSISLKIERVLTSIEAPEFTPYKSMAKPSFYPPKCIGLSA